MKFITGSNPAITVSLRGGLGNQLFCWAAGLQLARKLNLDLRLDASLIYQIRHDSLDPRRFELGHFGIKPQQRWPHFSGPLTRVTSKIPRFSRESNETTFEEEGPGYDPRFEEITSSVRLEGYFQSWRYFKDIGDEVRGALRDRFRARPETLMDKWVPSKSRWIGVHIRRGDYLRVGSMNLLDAEYYENAVQRAKLESGTDQVIVFSDNPEDARRVFSSADAYIGPQEIRSPGETVEALSSANSIVGSNSTFSWWAAYLAPDRLLPVYFPTSWSSGRTLDKGDFLLPEWQTIDTD